MSTSQSLHSNTNYNDHMINDLTKKVLRKIHSKAVMYQFILEELDAAQHGNDEAINFVKTSGISYEEYNGAMSRSFDEVDGPNGPQQTLLLAIMGQNLSLEQKASFRIKVVSNIINAYKECPFE